MNALFLTIACFAAALSSNGQIQVNQIAADALPQIEECIKQVPEWQTKEQMLESGLLKMDGYERYLANPKMTLKPLRDV